MSVWVHAQPGPLDGALQVEFAPISPKLENTMFYI